VRPQAQRSPILRRHDVGQEATGWQRGHIGWLALCLVRIAENATGATCCTVRSELEERH
jgi:hypothetical protein